MANLLSEEEYQYLTTLEKDLSERAEKSITKFGSVARSLEKQLSDFLAIENGRRVVSAKKDELKQKREESKIRRQQERLTALQAKAAKMQASQSTQNAQGGQSQKRPSNPSPTA